MTMRSHTIRKSLGSVALVAAMSLQASAASAGDFSPGHHPASYFGSAFASTLYFPAKLVFALGGALASGVAYVATLGDSQPSQRIWDASVEGDYIVTPSMIEGTDHVDFVGG
jgi:hypothetical protein